MKTGNDKEEEKSSLVQYGVDLISKARDGKLDQICVQGLLFWFTSCCI